MNKNLIIWILIAVCIISAAFNYYHKRESQANHVKALEFERLYNEMKRTAEEQRVMAENQKKAAEYQMARNQECAKQLAELTATK